MLFYLLVSILLLIAIVWIVAIIILITKIWETIRRYGIPRVQTKVSMINYLVRNINLSPWQIFIDVWCGNGSVLSAVQKKFPWVITEWYEINKTDYALANAKKKYFGNNYAIYNTNFFHEDLSDANIMYCYLMPHLMKSVWKKITKECKPWTMIYSNAFKIPNTEPISVLQLPSNTKFLNIIYVYKI